MVQKTKVALVMLLALLAATVSASISYAADPISTELYDVQGRVVGSASLTPTEDGATEVIVKVSGMNPVAGDRRLAISERGYCSADGDFSTAGDDAQTLPDVQFYANGSADYKMVVDDVDLDALADSNGSALVIYADTGDDAGDRIICGLLHADGAEAPAEETPAEEVPAEEIPAEETPAEEVPAEETPAEEVPAEETPAEEVPAEETPAEEYSLTDALNNGNGVILYDVNGRDVGFGLIFDLGDGETGVVFNLGGMEGGSADHRVAVTSAASCEAPDFASAGDEVMALPNVQFYSNGSADYGQIIEDLDLTGLNDDDGSSLVIYADAGEDPGDRIICGAFVSAEAALGFYGVTIDEFVEFVEALAGA